MNCQGILPLNHLLFGFISVQQQTSTQQSQSRLPRLLEVIKSKPKGMNAFSSFKVFSKQEKAFAYQLLDKRPLRIFSFEVNYGNEQI